MKAAPQATGRKLRCRDICSRYSIVPRTVDRWMATGVLPPPLVINNVRYWDEAEVEQRERQRLAARKPAPDAA